MAVLLTDVGCGRYWGVCKAAEAATVFAAFEWLVLPSFLILNFGGQE